MDSILDCAVRLYHRKEEERFNALIAIIRGQEAEFPAVEPSRVWFWGLKRWGRQWVDREYELAMSEKNERLGG
jgi:hypothetical protein